jgi:hypothetical protein
LRKPLAGTPNAGCDPVTCNLIEIRGCEVKAKLCEAIVGLEEDLETVLERLDNITDEERRWEN